MNEKNLDLSILPDSAAIAIKEGFKTFTEDNDRLQYFGYVDKRDLKDMCKRFRYTDAASFEKGFLLASAVIGIGYVGYKFVSKNKKEKNED